MLSNLSSTFDDFYSAQAISTLMRVMREPALNGHHTMAVQAVAFIFNVLGVRSVPYIQHVLPPFINVIRTGEPHIREVQYLHFFHYYSYFHFLLLTVSSPTIGTNDSNSQNSYKKLFGRNI
jgi:hypothetical protein